MHYYEKMYVIRHDFLRYKSYTFFFGYLFMEKFKVVCNFICKNLSSVFCRPYEMIICVVDTASSCYLMLFFVISIYTYGHYFISKLADYEKRKRFEVYGCIPCLKTRGLALNAPEFGSGCTGGVLGGVRRQVKYTNQVFKIVVLLSVAKRTACSRSAIRVPKRNSGAETEFGCLNGTWLQKVEGSKVFGKGNGDRN
ncbi:hypothetical protein MSLAZ_2984 [Methanosarcina lacustris Z-7289]|uniref:Uncharacterized protein n=1 Tax=Methanosarcina lacustris Z-7289 TaxID=1434111 RepID=A0A0E3WSD8_9EURY|nr:hypothetical protein MSLAZ_2984 [Methanosarcina lacustris Z-7289]